MIKILNVVKKFLINPKVRFGYFSKIGLYNKMSDKKYLQKKYELVTGKKLDLDNPQTFNEKLQWLKLYDRKEIYTTMVDKHAVKAYVASIIGEEYIIPTLGVYEKFDDINFEELPSQFVIKCTHDSGGLVIVRDKSKMDILKIKKKINKFLKRKYFYIHREWPYKNVEPKIIIEKYMEDHNFKSLRDYKFFCFNGEPKIMYTSEGLENHETARMSFYDMDYNEMDLKRKDYKLFDKKLSKPKNFEQMKEFAKKLSKDIPHLRVDFYEIDGKLYFGELTFTTCAGYLPFEKEDWNLELGSWIKLPEKSIDNEK